MSLTVEHGLETIPASKMKAGQIAKWHDRYIFRIHERMDGGSTAFVVLGDDREIFNCNFHEQVTLIPDGTILIYSDPYRK